MFKLKLSFLASEVNRLKLIVDDLKLSHEEKDNALSRIQIEIERLREVNLINLYVVAKSTEIFCTACFKFIEWFISR